MARFEATVDEIVFRNDQSGFTVATVKPDGAQPMAAVGIMPFLAAGERVDLEGELVEHREYGLQITAVDPALVRALTPGREALSARSSACVLESILAPLFSTATQTAVQLAGTRSEPKLIPAQPTSYTFPLRLSRL